MFRPADVGIVVGALCGARAGAACGVLVRIVLCGSMLRTVVWYPDTGSCAGFWFDGRGVLSCFCAGAAVAVVVAGTTGSGFGAPDAYETRPLLPLPTVSFVITVVFEFLRFVFFAAATSAESWAIEAAAATSRNPSTVLRMVRIINDFHRAA